MQKRQVKEFMGAFGGLVEHCFTSCVDDFTSKALSSRENGCINRCVMKWMATQQRVSDRFQEHNAQLSQQMQANNKSKNQTGSLEICDGFAIESAFEQCIEEERGDMIAVSRGAGISGGHMARTLAAKCMNI